MSRVAGRATGRVDGEPVFLTAAAATAATPATVTLAVAQTALASVALNIQWRHVLSSACRLAMANHMSLALGLILFRSS